MLCSSEAHARAELLALTEGFLGQTRIGMHPDLSAGCVIAGGSILAATTRARPNARETDIDVFVYGPVAAGCANLITRFVLALVAHFGREACSFRVTKSYLSVCTPRREFQLVMTEHLSGATAIQAFDMARPVA